MGARSERDKSGERYGMLTVIGKDEDKSKPQQCYVIVRCDCGTIKSVRYASLRSGSTVSCNCLKKTHNLIHGHNREGERSPEYKAWDSMMSRCYRVSSAGYEDYGGRGILVCEKWHTFENFLEDMGNRPSDKHSLDRENNEGSYCPENCRWATRQEQAENKRSNILFTIDGVTKCLSAWCREFDVNYMKIYNRVVIGNKPLEVAINECCSHNN